MMLYVLRRILAGALTLWFIATASFFAMHAVPGDPLADEKALDPQIRANLEAHYGLDQPVYRQYLQFLGNALQGDLGWSYVEKNRRVNDIIAEHFPVSASLGATALAFALVFALVGGSISAWYQRRWPDHAIGLLALLSISVPSFVIAALAQLAIVSTNQSLGWRVLPVAGWGSLAHIWVPALVLGLGTAAYLLRLLRSSMLEVMAADYSLTARAKGLSPWQRWRHHQLRNAMLPVLTELGPATAALLTGGFVVELIFAVPGMARYFVAAVQSLDYTVIMGTTVFYGAFLVTVVVLVDITYGLLDPRIRLYSADGRRASS